jgi:hypothetical protein
MIVMSNCGWITAGWLTEVHTFKVASLVCSDCIILYACALTNVFAWEIKQVTTLDNIWAVGKEASKETVYERLQRHLKTSRSRETLEFTDF